MRTITLLTVSLLLLSSCGQTQVKTAEFRGDDRTGLFFETGLLDQWPEKGPEEVFFIEGLGQGYGSPVIMDDLMYVTGTTDSISTLFCFDLGGILQWSMSLGKEWVVNYPGSRSSPTVVDDLIYVGTGMGNLFCINKHDQKVIWSKDLEKDFAGVLPLFGHSESPYIFENKVFWTAGGKEYNVVAMDRLTGELLWSSPGKGERSGYNHPRVVRLADGRDVLITFSAYHMMGFDVDSGELLWTHEQDNWPVEQRKFGYGDTHANTVIFEDNDIYYAEGDGNCGVKLAVSEDGNNIKEVWRNKSFDSYMGGVIKLGDKLYCGGTAKPYLYALDAASGVITDSLKVGRGALVWADNMLYYYNQSGGVHLVDYISGSLNDISSFRLTKGSQEHFSHPLIHDGIMYIRHGNIIVGYDINEVN